MEKIVRSIDLGYGQTKFIKDITPKGIIKTATIPSISVVASSGNSMVIDATNQHDVVHIEHNNNKYLAGQDIHYLSNSYSHRVLNKDYILSDDYHVLMKSALLMMNISFIDVLVIGVPVKYYDSSAKHLQATWKGEIKLNSNNKVQVNKVIVVMQPLGSFYKFATGFNNFDLIKSQRTLIIDVGYFTVDWIVIKDMKFAGSNDSYEGGMSFLLLAIEEKIGRGTNNPITLNKIDEYFYKNEPVYINGEQIDMNNFIPIIESTVERTYHAMMNSVKDLTNIENILLVGGGAKVYKPTIQKHFGGRKINTFKSQELANVLGYQTIGESFFNKAF